MGLDISHDCWHGAYSGFAEFREALGRAAGLPYLAEKQYRHDKPTYTLDIDWDQVTDAQINGDWKEPPRIERVGYDPPLTDPVLYLLIHSDCEGKLRCKYLKHLKTRLGELAPKFDEMTKDKSHYLNGRLDQFIEGLALAIKKGDDVVFQ